MQYVTAVQGNKLLLIVRITRSISRSCQNGEFWKLNQAASIFTAMLERDNVGNELPRLASYVFKLVDLQLLH